MSFEYKKISIEEFDKLASRNKSVDGPEVKLIMGLRLNEAILMDHGQWTCKPSKNSNSYNCGLRTWVHNLSKRLTGNQKFTVKHPKEYAGKKIAIARVEGR